MDVNQYLRKFFTVIKKIEFTMTASGKHLTFSRGVEIATETIQALKKRGNKLIFVGNGGSAAIAVHQAADFLKQCGIKTYAPFDPSLLTCMANDYGYPKVFSEPLKTLVEKGDILVAISSSGRSENILNAVGMVQVKSCYVITMSGFNRTNPLRKEGDLNFYVPSSSYRYVETAHQLICDCILDCVLGEK